ncbi:hypothetical protein PS726_04319 [Pseudomonas fluorescens]|uniref:hypothetical protein n=1 Tax=Pseudomonas fluorescens TaxID=294 RepID=UPI000F92E705|nr:hypothetical protein [Pseudomonas fluorescens]VVO22397.1 hypothetical protein PS726_04319 [Pseudomonas fluorescens]
MRIFSERPKGDKPAPTLADPGLQRARDSVVSRRESSISSFGAAKGVLKNVISKKYFT